MNLYLRLLWVLLRGHWLPALGFSETLVQRWRVLPNDIDINFHMNNGRYLTMVDLGLTEFFTRTGFLEALLKNGWRCAVSRDGIVPTSRYLATFPESGHELLEQMLARPLTDDVIAWRESEHALMQRVRTPRD